MTNMRSKRKIQEQGKKTSGDFYVLTNGNAMFVAQSAWMMPIKENQNGSEVWHRLLRFTVNYLMKAKKQVEQIMK